MSDGPQPHHRHLKKLNDAREAGYFNRPGAEHMARDMASQLAYEQGKRMRMRATVAADGPEQTLGEAILVAFALAGGAAGFWFGVRRVGSGEGTFGGAVGLGAAGAVGGMIVWGAIVGSVRWMRRALMWRWGRSERDADLLGEMWEARFGRPVAGELVAEVDGDGSGWVVDGKGRFHLRMKTGRVVVVDASGDDLKLEGSGGAALPSRTPVTSSSSTSRSVAIESGSTRARRSTVVGSG